MRSRSTNFLQIVILFTGIVYTVFGALYFISPLFFGKLLALDINEDWVHEIPTDAFISTLYYMARALSALLFSIGLAMVLPLFDPLRYRGLVYYTGVLFPSLAALPLIKNGISLGHLVLSVSGIIAMIIAALTLTALLATRGKAKSGID